MVLIFGFVFIIVFSAIALLFFPSGLSLSLLFIDVPSFLIILIPGIFFLTVTKCHKFIIQYLLNSFKKDYVFQKIELRQLAFTLGSLIKIVLSSGMVGFFIGLISLFTHLDDPGNIGPSVSVSLLSIYYSILISFFCLYPTKIWAERKIMEA